MNNHGVKLNFVHFVKQYSKKMKNVKNIQNVNVVILKNYITLMMNEMNQNPIRNFKILKINDFLNVRFLSTPPSEFFLNHMQKNELMNILPLMFLKYPFDHNAYNIY